MLDDIQAQSYYYQVDPNTVANSSMFAYADDLNGVSPSKEHLQEMADIVSAFNAITGFSFNDKLECGTNQKGDFGGEIYAHDKEWNVIKVPIKAELTTVILGVPVDLTNKWNKLKQYI